MSGQGVDLLRGQHVGKGRHGAAAVPDGGGYLVIGSRALPFGIRQIDGPRPVGDGRQAAATVSRMAFGAGLGEKRGAVGAAIRGRGGSGTRRHTGADRQHDRAAGAPARVESGDQTSLQS